MRLMKERNCRLVPVMEPYKKSNVEKKGHMVKFQGAL